MLTLVSIGTKFKVIFSLERDESFLIEINVITEKEEDTLKFSGTYEKINPNYYTLYVDCLLSEEKNASI